MFDCKPGIALHAIQGNRASSLTEGGSLMVFLMLQWEPGVYYRVMAGVAIQNSCLLSEVRTPV